MHADAYAVASNARHALVPFQQHHHRHLVRLAHGGSAAAGAGSGGASASVNSSGSGDNGDGGGGGGGGSDGDGDGGSVSSFKIGSKTIVEAKAAGHNDADTTTFANSGASGATNKLQRASDMTMAQNDPTAAARLVQQGYALGGFFLPFFP